MSAIYAAHLVAEHRSPGAAEAVGREANPDPAHRMMLLAEQLDRLLPRLALAVWEAAGAVSSP
ncbi:hypothetical protein AB0L97_38315 [Nocardia sp. NPDC051911]|uniref:hypothetical protein n=1 Tax=Nocardia sp. NPDC051911 TaxID=3154648 RepID=UPI00342DA589